MAKLADPVVRLHREPELLDYLRGNRFPAIVSVNFVHREIDMRAQIVRAYFLSGDNPAP